MTTYNIISISGGKDSTALWLHALERKTKNIITVFADTGHEHPETYEYVDYLERKLGKITKVKADFTKQIQNKRDFVKTKWRDQGVEKNIIEDALSVLHPTGNPMLDLAIWKGRFPSTRARFCTQELKVIPIMEEVYNPLLDEGHKVISWQGVRSGESKARSNLEEYESTPEGFDVYRPILDWSVKDVFKKHVEHEIKYNPLYLQGMSRVGCMPCIHSRKSELYEISRRYPEEIERVAEWEEIVAKASKKGAASFFPHSDVAGNSISEYVEWSKTARGGKQYDLEKIMGMEDVPTCSSQYGLCE